MRGSPQLFQTTLSTGVIYGHDTISMSYGKMSYLVKLTGVDLSRY